MCRVVGLIALFFLNGLAASSDARQPDSSYSFSYKIAKSFGLVETDITIKDAENNRSIGYIVSARLPFSTYVLHSFYIYPEFRGQGYGTKLFEHALDNLQAENARWVFVQPGPFEIQNSKGYNLPAGPERDSKYQKLIAFYQKHKFKLAPRCAGWLAFIAYKLLGIEEDYHYLMLRKMP